VYGVSTAAAIAVPGEWTHVAVTFDGKTAALYVNGNLGHVVTSPTGSDPSAQRQFISSFTRGPSHQGLSGMIDDARFDSRRLSADEVRSAYLGD
jgi:hypothetical protein